jgi:hypothetical protein
MAVGAATFIVGDGDIELLSDFIELSADSADTRIQVTSSGVAVRDQNSNNVIGTTGGTDGQTLALGAQQDTLFLTAGGVVLRSNVAPADADIPVQGAALWFDPTNGAAKLMVKAKQSDGTVKTGSFNVQT